MSRTGLRNPRPLAPMPSFQCPNCDAFPYDTAEELEAHIASGGHAHLNRAITREVAMEAARVRAQGNGYGRKAAAPLANLATNKQIAFIAKLAAERKVPAPEVTTKRDASRAIDKLLQTPVVEVATTGPAPTEKQLAFIARLAAEKGVEVTVPPTKALASAAIDRLMAMPAAKVAPAKAEVPEGLHLLDGQAYKVKISKAGRPYAEKLVGHSWSYDAARAERAIAKLSADTVATLEEAAKYGRLTGTCACCARELTNPDSIARGVGPWCAAKYF